MGIVQGQKIDVQLWFHKAEPSYLDVLELLGQLEVVDDVFEVVLQLADDVHAHVLVARLKLERKT